MQIYTVCSSVVYFFPIVSEVKLHISFNKYQNFHLLKNEHTDNARRLRKTLVRKKQYQNLNHYLNIETIRKYNKLTSPHECFTKTFKLTLKCVCLRSNSYVQFMYYHNAEQHWKMSQRHGFHDCKHVSCYCKHWTETLT